MRSRATWNGFLRTKPTIFKTACYSFFRDRSVRDPLWAGFPSGPDRVRRGNVLIRGAGRRVNAVRSRSPGIPNQGYVGCLRSGHAWAVRGAAGSPRFVPHVVASQPLRQAGLTPPRRARARTRTVGARTCWADRGNPAGRQDSSPGQRQGGHAESAGLGEQVALPAELEGVTEGEPDQGSCRGKPICTAPARSERPALICMAALRFRCGRRALPVRRRPQDPGSSVVMV